MNTSLFVILYEDEQLLVINKPAGLVCHPTKGDEYSSLVGRIRLYLGQDAQPHFVNRLDRETSGIVVVAKSPATAATLNRLWEERRVEKEYFAIVKGLVKEERGRIEAPLGKDVHSAVAIKDCVRPDGALAITAYDVAARGNCSAGDFSLLRVVTQTGRKHQIRIHLQHVGHPIVGDKLYGGDEGLYLGLVMGTLTAEQTGSLILPYQALHAARIRLLWAGNNLELKCSPEEWFCDFVSRFSGFSGFPGGITSGE